MRRAVAVALALLVVVGCAGRAPSPVPSPAAPVTTGTTHHLDAHDGGIVQAADTFYLFGTSYDCGFQWNTPGTTWCGFNIYTSPDLVAWTLQGKAFDATPWQATCTPGGCYRPHVVHNATTGKWVMWFNVFSGTYRVFSAPAPGGPWTLEPGADTVPAPSGDSNLFVDTDGTGYLIRTDLNGHVATGSTHELVVEKLTADYLNVTGTSARAPVGFVEAPSMWERGGRYYLAYSNPACPYCTGTGTAVLESASPLGPWGVAYSITPQACGQPTHVSVLNIDGRRVDLYQTDVWVLHPGDAITANQSDATQVWVPLSYNSAGHALPVGCT
jgi:beta-xylosidase